MSQNVLILKFPYSSALGGGEKHTITLVEELKKRSFKFYLASSCEVLLKEFKEKKWPAKEVWAGKEPVTKLSVIIFPLLAPLAFLKLLSLIINYRLIKKTKILYCLSLTEKILITIPAKLLGFKVFWIEHTLPGRWLEKNPYKPFYILSSHFATTIAVSGAAKDKLINLGLKEKGVKVILHGINLSKKRQDSIYQLLASNNLTIRRSQFIVGTVARLSKEKGIEYLLKAIKLVKEIIPNIQLIIVGDGPEKKYLLWLRRQLDIENQVKFVGWQEDFRKWVSNFDIFVLPSIKKESFGLVLLEAMVYAKPIIATTIGGIPEVVKNNETGILVEPKDPEALAQAIFELHQRPDLQKKLGKNAREKVEKEFPLEKMVEEYYQLFK